MTSSKVQELKPSTQFVPERTRERPLKFDEVPFQDCRRPGDRSLPATMEQQRPALLEHLPHRLPPEKVKPYTDRPVVRWTPDSETSRKIRLEAKHKIGQPLAEGHKRTVSSEVAVQAGLTYLKGVEGVKTAVRITSGGGADIMALSSKGELILAECKGTGQGKTLEPGWLTASGGEFENQASWLSSNRRHMLATISAEMEGARGGRRDQLELLWEKVSTCKFREQGSYKRYVIYAGEGLNMNSVRGYDRKVKPDKYVIIPLDIPQKPEN